MVLWQRFFNVISGVKQGCLLSPSLFGLSINCILRKVNALGRCVIIGPDEQLSILLYADDMALITGSEKNLLDLLSVWCQEWGVKVNPKKSEIFHLGTPRAQKFQNLLFDSFVVTLNSGWSQIPVSRFMDKSTFGFQGALLQMLPNLPIEHLVFSSQSLSSLE